MKTHRDPSPIYDPAINPHAMKTQFTPGRWILDGDDIVVETKIGGDIVPLVICTLGLPGLYNTPDVLLAQAANGQLILAAPDLLGACQSALRALLDNTCPGPMDADAIAGLRAAIAKAQS